PFLSFQFIFHKLYIIKMADIYLNTPVNQSYVSPKPLDLRGGQCSWCGKYGHKRIRCPFLK
ncbi:hypothetical protein BJ944DRAFT_52342, partial [Cunninghamella echinulata]